ncbi:UDP-N-acetylmuramate dehydrogenase [candidate division FCPU426 bacterium]|nr:UDP-N-acetylmuramate dehydrogenase [candidate division FCPU426 bacterium]
MARECSFRLGGNARYFCTPLTAEALRDCIEVCRRLSLAYIVIGGGANLVFRDDGFDGVVLSTKGLNHFSIVSPGRVQVGAGLDNADLTAYTLQYALTGFEWASGLPGTVGGGIFMNAKCYGASFADIVLTVTALTSAEGLTTKSKADCGFTYKNSVFQQSGEIIVSAMLGLTPGQTEAIAGRTKEVLQDRMDKGQFLFPSAGCVFKNDYHCGIPAGSLIETAGLKGRQIGGVRVFEQHANFLVNTGRGRTQDILDLMALIQDEVFKKHGVRLEPEIKIVP